MGGESRWGGGMWPAQHGQDQKRPGQGCKVFFSDVWGWNPQHQEGSSPSSLADMHSAIWSDQRHTLALVTLCKIS